MLSTASTDPYSLCLNRPESSIQFKWLFSFNCSFHRLFALLWITDNAAAVSSWAKTQHKKTGLPHFAPEVWINTVKRWHVNWQGEKTRRSFSAGGERCRQVIVHKRIQCINTFLLTVACFIVSLRHGHDPCTWCLTTAYEKWYSFVVPLAFSLLFLKERNVYELLHDTQCQRPAAALLLFDVWCIQSCY